MGGWPQYRARVGRVSIRMRHQAQQRPPPPPPPPPSSPAIFFGWCCGSSSVLLHAVCYLAPYEVHIDWPDHHWATSHRVLFRYDEFMTYFALFVCLSGMFTTKTGSTTQEHTIMHTTQLNPTWKKKRNISWMERGFLGRSSYVHCSVMLYIGNSKKNRLNNYTHSHLGLEQLDNSPTNHWVCD